MQPKKEGETMNKFSDFNIQPEFPLFGTRESINTIINKPIQIVNFKFIEVQLKEGVVPSAQIQFKYLGESVNRVTFTRSKIVKKQLEQLNKNLLPIEATFKQRYEDGTKSTYIE